MHTQIDNSMDVLGLAANALGSHDWYRVIVKGFEGLGGSVYMEILPEPLDQSLVTRIEQ